MDGYAKFAETADIMADQALARALIGDELVGLAVRNAGGEGAVNDHGKAVSNGDQGGFTPFHAQLAEALSEMVGIIVVEGVAEAALLRMIFETGLRAIREKAEELAYASAAEDRLASGEADETRQIARRRRPAWAAED